MRLEVTSYEDVKDIEKCTDKTRNSPSEKQTPYGDPGNEGKYSVMSG